MNAAKRGSVTDASSSTAARNTGSGNGLRSPGEVAVLIIGAMVARPPAPPTLLQSGRTECRDRRVVAAAQRRATDPAPWGHPPSTLRGARSAQPQLVAGSTLLLCRVAPPPGWRRLPCPARGSF